MRFSGSKTTRQSVQITSLPRSSSKVGKLYIGDCIILSLIVSPQSASSSNGKMPTLSLNTNKTVTQLNVETVVLSHFPSMAAKAMAKIMLIRRLADAVDRRRSTIDMTFVARLLQQKRSEQYQDLCMTFVDLTKAFDAVN